jgi:hypothetical protein
MRTSTLLPVLLVGVLLFASQSAGAVPRFFCYTVQPGDTASRLALRLTGDINVRHEARFQILDPLASRFIPKIDYEHIEPGWQACIQQEMGAYAPRPVGRGTHTSANMADGLGWWWLTFLCCASLLAWMAAQTYSDRRKATIRALEHYGVAFVREFERPLRQYGPRNAAADAGILRSQLSFIPHRSQMEILVAPNDGHRYPNLSDHRRNVEYDVQRVMQTLDDKRFFCGELAARGPWVVIPFRFEPRLPSRSRLSAPGGISGR